MTGQHIHLMEEQLFTSFSCRSGRGLMLRTCPAKQVLHVTVTCKMGFFWLQEALLLLTPYKITFFFCRICLNGKHRGNTNLCSVFLFCRELMSRKAGGDTDARALPTAPEVARDCPGLFHSSESLCLVYAHFV